MFAQITKEAGTDAGPNPSRYLHYDQLGSIAAISDATRTVVECLAYDAWGMRRSVSVCRSHVAQRRQTVSVRQTADLAKKEVSANELTRLSRLLFPS